MAGRTKSHCLALSSVFPQKSMLSSASMQMVIAFFFIFLQQGLSLCSQQIHDQMYQMVMEIPTQLVTTVMPLRQILTGVKVTEFNQIV